MGYINSHEAELVEEKKEHDGVDSGPSRDNSLQDKASNEPVNVSSGNVHSIDMEEVERGQQTQHDQFELTQGCSHIHHATIHPQSIQQFTNPQLFHQAAQQYLSQMAFIQNQHMQQVHSAAVGPRVGFIPQAVHSNAVNSMALALQQHQQQAMANLGAVTTTPVNSIPHSNVILPTNCVSTISSNNTYPPSLSPTNNVYSFTSSVPPQPCNLNIPFSTQTTTLHPTAFPIIPHYIPPTPPTWGSPLPLLTVQDRPLVPPIYNGINPHYPKAHILHSHPPIFCVVDFLSPAECDFLIGAAGDAFGPAPVVGAGQGELSPSRTSSTCYLAREDLPEYIRKIGLLTGKPPEHCELPQVGRYLPSQQYLQHFDAFDLSNEDGLRFAANGGQRIITILTYLNDVDHGGATVFPHLNLQIQPRRGMALVFFPSTLDGLLDKMAVHAALPAVDVKYVSQVWVRQTNYEGRPSKRLVEPMVAGLQERRVREELEKTVQAQLLGIQLQQQQEQLG